MLGISATVITDTASKLFDLRDDFLFFIVMFFILSSYVFVVVKCCNECQLSLLWIQFKIEEKKEIDRFM